MFPSTLLASFAGAFALTVQAPDADGDGLSDALEEELGSDPLQPDVLVDLGGELRLPSGEAAVGASVRLQDVGAAEYHVRCDQKGRFTLQAVPASFVGLLIGRHIGKGSGYTGVELELTPEARSADATRPGLTTLRWLGRIELSAREPNTLLPGSVELLADLGDLLPYDVALADLDKDGFLDAVVATGATSAYAYVLRGLGDGSFVRRIRYPLDGSVQASVALGDLNEDGNTDLAACTINGHNTQVRFGQNDGRFGPETNVVGSNPGPVRLADVDGDAHLDLLVLYRFSQVVHVLLGDGHGGFASPLSSSVPPQARSFELGDLDGDGRIEIVTCHETGTVAVLPNLGGGSFGAALRTTVGGALQSLALGQLDEDGFLDVVTVGNALSLSLLRGEGDLGFAPREAVSLGDDGNTAVETVDVDRDGDLDVVVGRDGDPGFAPEEATLLRNGGDATFERDVLRTVTAPTALAAGDVDRDGWNDLCFVSRLTDTVACYRSDRAGGFEVGRREALPAGNRAKVTDLDADGHLEVALIGVSQLVTWFGTGDGGFRSPVSFATPGLNECVLHDLDHDGLPDLIAAEASGVNVYRGKGDGTFELRSTHPTHIKQYVALGRVDRDHRLDILMTGESGSGHLVQCLRGNPAGGFESPRDTLQVSFDSETPRAGDLNGDGIIDLVFPHFFNGQVEVYLGTGDGAFRLLTRLLLPGQATDVLFVDLDQDGWTDLVFACPRERRIVVYPGLGSGGLGPQRAFALGGGPVGLLAEDLDLDGKRDLVVGQGDRVDLLRGDGQRGFLATITFAAGRATSLASGDFDEDGAPDLVLGGGGMTLLRNQGFR